MLRLPSVVGALIVALQVTVTVKDDSDPPRPVRLVGVVGHGGRFAVPPTPGKLLFGSRTCHAPHSIPARALWYARTPVTSSWPLDCCIPVTETMNPPSSASTTRRKIAATMLNPV